MNISVVAAFTFVLAFAASVFGQAKTEYNVFARDEQELRKIERRWAEAMEREDVAAVQKILGDDYIMIDSVGVAASRAEMIDQLRSGNLKFDAFTTSDVKARIFQGGGVLTGKLAAKGKYKDQDISGDYLFVDVFEFKQGSWKPVYTQLTKVRTEK